MTSPSRCTSRKWWYSTQEVANESARKDEEKYGWVMRTYLCPECDWWHKARMLHRGLPVLTESWLTHNADLEDNG